MNLKQHVPLAIALILIVSAIAYLESQKATSGNGLVDVVFDENATDVTQDTLFTTPSDILDMKTAQYELAPELRGIHSYINAAPFNLSDLRGQVVMVDFWTYSCINCIRTIPYLNAWDRQYRNDGLVIVGIHTPEFEFEQEYENVVDAVQRYNVSYPVVQDNDYATWRAYNNRWWPRKFIVDIDGFIRYDHIGEGAYGETENVIRELLEERAQRFGSEFDNSMAVPIDAIDVNFTMVGTPELYFGYEFDRGQLGNPEGLPARERVNYTIPPARFVHKPYLGGDWEIHADYAEVVSDEGRVVLTYSAKAVNIVASSENQVEIDVLLNNESLTEETVGRDDLVIHEEKLYNLIDYEYGQHTIEITAPKGFRLYTFTFG